MRPQRVSQPALRVSLAPSLGARAASAVRVVFGMLAFFLILEFITSLGLVPAVYLPRASTVVQRMVELLVDVSFLKHVLATLGAWAGGLAIAAAISMLVGILIGTSELAYKMISPVIEFMRPIPSVALIPLAILLWGQGLPDEGNIGGSRHYVANPVQHRVRGSRRRPDRGPDRALLRTKTAGHSLAHYTPERGALDIHRYPDFRGDRPDRCDRVGTSCLRPIAASARTSFSSLCMAATWTPFLPELRLRGSWAFSSTASLAWWTAACLRGDTLRRRPNELRTQAELDMRRAPSRASCDQPWCALGLEPACSCLWQ